MAAGITGRGVASRVKGVNALRRRLGLALIHAQRYGHARAATEAERAYAADVMADLQRILDRPYPHEVNYVRRPVRKRMAKMTLEQGDLL